MSLSLVSFKLIYIFRKGPLTICIAQQRKGRAFQVLTLKTTPSSLVTGAVKVPRLICRTRAILPGVGLMGIASPLCLAYPTMSMTGGQTSLLQRSLSQKHHHSNGGAQASLHPKVPQLQTLRKNGPLGVSSSHPQKTLHRDSGA